MMKKKLKSQAGESIGETLVSLLIAALALVMLAGAISASSGVIMKGRNKLNAYYTANEAESGVVKMKSGTRGDDDIMTLTDRKGQFTGSPSYPVTYYKNNEFNNRIVIAYKYTP